MLESVRQRMDKVQQIHLSGGLLHGLASDAVRAQPDVVLQRPRKQIRVLQDHAELAAQLLRIDLAPTTAMVSPGSMVKAHVGSSNSMRATTGASRLQS
jgi:hypothetical protein